MINKFSNIEAATNNLIMILVEINHALDNFVKNKKTHIIDIRAVPLHSNEEDELLKILDVGEVRVDIEALGKSEVYETKFSGVWLISHYNLENEIVARFIEITDCPSIIKSNETEIISSLDLLCGTLGKCI